MDTPILLKERIADAVIYIFAIIPVLIGAIGDVICTPFSFGVQNCIVGPIGDSIVNFFLGYGFLIVFGGFIVWIPIMIIASVISIRSRKKTGRKIFYSPPFIFLYLTALVIIAL